MSSAEAKNALNSCFQTLLHLSSESADRPVAQCSLSRAVTARNSCETGELGNCLICLQRPNKDPALSESQTVKDQDAKPRDGGPSQKEHSWGSWSGYQRQTDMVTWSSTETPNIRRFSFFSGNQWLIVDVHFGMRNQGFLSKWTVAVDL
jgi:hypothetical protein